MLLALQKAGGQALQKNGGQCEIMGNMVLEFNPG